MSANPQPRPLVTGDLDLLISRSLDGDLPGEEERDLKSLLAADASARARYDAMARLVGKDRTTIEHRINRARKAAP